MASSFLYIGITLAILSLSGKNPVFKDWFIISVMELESSYLICLRILTDNPSCPQLDLVFKPSIMLTGCDGLTFRWPPEVSIDVQMTESPYGPTTREGLTCMEIRMCGLGFVEPIKHIAFQGISKVSYVRNSNYWTRIFYFVMTFRNKCI